MAEYISIRAVGFASRSSSGYLVDTVGTSLEDFEATFRVEGANGRIHKRLLSCIRTWA